jgi:hypothetical protein
MAYESIELGGAEQALEAGRTFARPFGTGKEPILPAPGEGPDTVFDGIVVDRQMSGLGIANQCRQAYCGRMGR